MRRRAVEHRTARRSSRSLLEKLPDQVQRHRDRPRADLRPAARQHRRPGDPTVRSRHAEVHQPDRLLRRSAARTRDPGDAHADVGAEPATGPVGQGDGETLEKVEPTTAQVVEWKP